MTKTTTKRLARNTFARVTAHINDNNNNNNNSEYNNKGMRESIWANDKLYWLKIYFLFGAGWLLLALTRVISEERARVRLLVCSARSFLVDDAKIWIYKNLTFLLWVGEKAIEVIRATCVDGSTGADVYNAASARFSSERALKGF